VQIDGQICIGSGAEYSRRTGVLFASGWEWIIVSFLTLSIYIFRSSFYQTPSLLFLKIARFHAIPCEKRLDLWQKYFAKLYQLIVEKALSDIPDIVNLIKANQIDFTAPEFVKLCEKFGTKEIYKKIVSYLNSKREG